ncbi:hypothetical protein G6M89_21495 [Natronolimnobius sp. AArcel1]|uniref:hypothetical protein n=1 Tax=Natronolimnobius sp. AArcel1 TaxID=1679093 RepID=UPI0013EC6200|nr:hypothetical protein [Natronolimnobius sp. AArcel1]NGM71524.1 hypothetical protein [Natronolimnobius sp. AArcel1]
MSRSNRSSMHVGCPECGATVSGFVPPGPGISTDETNRLRGRETVCDGCGHELEFYFY